ncbi:SDR family oxidoreductase [Niallia sp. BSM11]|uniref:SDR family oxidoreductase n=1 Tax=Niallia sp. BSM11 TaxID=3391576 RepID=UPI003984B788
MFTDSKVALVTGGNRGIGYELVRQLALKGFKVILTSRDSKKGLEAVKKLRKSNLEVSFLEMDVNNHESIRQAAITVDQHFGRLDVLINNAGVYLDEDDSLLTMDPAILEKTMETNFFGAYYTIQSFLPLMEKYGYGRIINISSDYGRLSQLTSPEVGAYKLSKFALNGLTQLIAGEVKDDIKVNAADPGWVSTDMGGTSAPTTPKQAAESILWLTAIGSDGPSGKFFRGKNSIDW